MPLQLQQLQHQSESAAATQEATANAPLFPDPAFSGPVEDRRGRRMPQAIAHRGYRARFPENSVRAFREAVAAGAHALETDVHLTRDNVVVLSHDATLKRCFGIDKRLLDCDWDFVKTVRSIAPPHEPIARLEELLEYLAAEAQQTWVLLDIKVDNDPDAILRQLADAVAAVPASKARPWEQRIVLGCWAAKFVTRCHEHMPGFSVANIGFSVTSARQFLSVPQVAFNMFFPALLSPLGRWLIRGARARGRKVYAWTVNEVKGMDWCIRRGLDGVISDDPALFLRVCDGFDEHRAGAWPIGLTLRLYNLGMLACLFGVWFHYKHGYGLDGEASLAARL